MSNTTAIILAAGVGSRFLPVAKAVNKCMMPLGNKPVVQYLVEDCLDAGIQDIIIAVPKGEDTIPNHFATDEDLITALKQSGKDDIAQELEHLNQVSQHVSFCPVTYEDGHGSTVPVRAVLRQKKIDSERILIANGDAIIASDTSPIGEIKKALDGNDDKSGMLFGFKVPLERRHSYGVIIQDSQTHKATSILEKPDDTVSPNSLNANVGWYLVPSSIAEYVEHTPKNEGSGEWQITDVINAMLTDHEFVVHSIAGEYLDCGNPTSWLKANNYLSNMIL